MSVPERDDRRPDERRAEPKAARKSDARERDTRDRDAKERDTREREAKEAKEKKRGMLDATLAAVDQLQVDALAIGLCEDERPLAGIAAYVDWRLCGRLSQMLRSGEITGRRGEKVLAKTDGQTSFARMFFFGWGPRVSLLDGAAERFRFMVETLDKARVGSVAVALPEPGTSLLGLVEEHLERPLGAKLHGVFLPDEKLAALRETRPIPMPSLDKPVPPPQKR